MAINFEAFAASLLPRAESLVAEWLPNGKRRGHEYVVGSLGGEAGDSLCINITTGRWADFATGDKGGDLISLFAAIRGLGQGDAARALGYVNGSGGAQMPAPPRKPAVIDAPAERPPADAPEPGPHYRHGPHAALYAYRDADGLIGYVARYEPPGERKQFSPWRWLNGRWEAKALPKPRPLYGLELLAAAKPEKRVMLVEGEKAADALRPVLTTHVVMTWAGGAKAIDTVDFAPLAGRKVDLWPDADQPGREAMAVVGVKLLRLGCAPVRVVIPEGQPDGWDAADAVGAGWDKQAIATWILRDGGRYLVTLTLPVEPQGAQNPETVPPSSAPGAAPAAPAVPSATPEPKVEVVPAGPTSVADERALWERMGLETRVGNGVPPANEDTVDRALHYCGAPYWFDTFLQRAMTSWERTPAGWAIGTPRPIRDSDHAALTVWFQRDLRLHKMSMQKVQNGLELYIYKHRRNSAQDWLNGLNWDQQARLDYLMEAAFGCPADEYHRAVSRNFLMGMVARVLSPGCQVDYMPILEGGQGVGKSSALRAIGGEWFTEATDSILTKDFLQNMQGKMLIEIAELHAFSKADQDRIKGIITNRVDTYRASYGRISGDYPRQCVFAGTTNRDDWVTDDTGARRFWRVLTGKIDIAWILANREQLFAEAVARYKTGEPYWHVPQDVAKRLQDGARTEDDWQDVILRWAARYSEVFIDDIFSHALELGMDKRDKRAGSRVRSILRTAGWETVTVWDKGKSRRAWRNVAAERGGTRKTAASRPAAAAPDYGMGEPPPDAELLTSSDDSTAFEMSGTDL